MGWRIKSFPSIESNEFLASDDWSKKLWHSLNVNWIIEVFVLFFSWKGRDFEYLYFCLSLSCISLQIFQGSSRRWKKRNVFAYRSGRQSRPRVIRRCGTRHLHRLVDKNTREETLTETTPPTNDQDSTTRCTDVARSARSWVAYVRFLRETAANPIRTNFPDASVSTPNETRSRAH